MPATKIWADCSHPLHSSALPAKARGSWHPGRPGEGLAAAASKGSRRGQGRAHCLRAIRGQHVSVKIPEPLSPATGRRAVPGEWSLHQLPQPCQPCSRGTCTQQRLPLVPVTAAATLHVPHQGQCHDLAGRRQPRPTRKVLRHQSTSMFGHSFSNRTPQSIEPGDIN